MRHAIYYESPKMVHRNDGAPLYVWNVLKNQLKFDVEQVIPRADRMNGIGNFDYHWWVDWGEDALRGILDYEPIECPKPSIYWSSDTHLGYDYRLKKAREFTNVFCMQKRAAEEFTRDGVKATWIPHAFEPQAYPKRTIIPRYDICFIGNLNSMNRIEFLDYMFREFPNFYYGKKVFEEAAEKFCSSKIVLNVSIKDDLNMRVFEALGTGSFLLTNDIPTLHELFTDGVHLVTYKTLDEAVDKTRYYLAHDAERQKIAQAGYEEVMARHTYRHRVEAMMKHAGIAQEALCLQP